jgi:hypothetical protein
MDTNIIVRLMADGIPLLLLLIMAFLYFKKSKS